MRRQTEPNADGGSNRASWTGGRHAILETATGSQRKIAFRFKLQYQVPDESMRMNRGNQPRRVSKKQKQVANEQLRQIELDVSGHKGNCLFVIDDDGGYCNKLVNNNCHIVSESAVLSKLKDKDGKVLVLEWGVSQWRRLIFRDIIGQLVQDTPTFNPPERRAHDACVGWFACNPPHDSEFYIIDVAEPDFSDPVVRFLSGYRMELFLADQCRLAIELEQKWLRSAMRNHQPGVRALLLAEKEKLKNRFRRAESAVQLLGKNWHTRQTGGAFDLDIVSAQVLTFRSKLRFAGGVSYGKATSVTVFPSQGDLHMMGVLYLTSESDLAREDIERLADVARASEKSDDYGVTMTEELMTNGWGSLAASPESFHGLNDQDRRTIQRLIAEHSGSQMWN